MEEELIYEIVDSIVNNQDKIMEISEKIENPAKDEIYQREILYRKHLLKNIRNIQKLQERKKINEKNLKKMKEDFQFKNEQIKAEESKINKILLELIKNNDNNNEFYKISYEKLKNMVLNKENERILKNLNDEYNDINLNFNNLLNDINNLELKKNEYEQSEKMLEEEKESIDGKIIEYMSLKETYEEIAKLQLKLFIYENLKNNDESNTQRRDNNGDKNNNTNIIEKKQIKININNIDRNIEIYFYEINNLDINLLGNEISKQIINIINHYAKSLDNINQNNNKENNLYINKSTGFQKFKKSYMNEIFDDNENINLNLIINKSKILYNKSDIKSLISILSSKITKEIINHLTSSKSKNNNKNNIVNTLLKSLKEVIISFINIYYSSYIKIALNNPKEQNLTLFIKYFIKSFYYENIITSDFLFINENYPKKKEIIRNYISLLEKNINELNSEKEEYALSKKQLEEKIKYLNEEINNNCNILTKDEMTYIELNQKLNDLQNEKKKLEYDLIIYQNENNFNDEKVDNKIDKLKSDNIILQKNILTCQEERKLKNKQKKMEIDLLQKGIKDKFIIIKNQLRVYKKKYGDNMTLYNKFVDKINETLKLTSNNTYDNISNDDLFRNTQSTFYKTNKKRNIKKCFFTPEKIKINTNSQNLNIY